MNEDRNSILNSNKDSHSIIGKKLGQIMEENKLRSQFVGKSTFNVNRLKAVKLFNKNDPIFSNYLKEEDKEKLIKGSLIDSLSKELYNVAKIEKIENYDLGQVKFIASVDVVEKRDLTTFSLTKTDNKNKVLAAFEIMQKSPRSYSDQIYLDLVLQQIENGEIKIS